MLKIFVTGDNHIGRKYDRYPDVREVLIKSRFDSLERMVKKAEEEQCSLFAVTGDLFDGISSVKQSDVKKTAEILSSFDGTVLVLPGNHDYYTGSEKVWTDFMQVLEKYDHNIVLLNEYREYRFDAGEDKAVIYPAFCQSKHSSENNLGWIRNSDIDTENVINIGIAHGAIKGVTPDMKEEYFLMTESELEAIPMDAWLIGHTHIPFPSGLSEEKETTGFRIFNAGTHEQTDLHNNTKGWGFIVTIEKNGGNSIVTAKKCNSGRVSFHDIQLHIKPESDDALFSAVHAYTAELDKLSVVRLNISGSVKTGEYENKDRIYGRLLENCLSYEINDSELSEEISIEKIRSEFAETSFAARFMEELIEDPTELQMAYELLQNCRE